MATATAAAGSEAEEPILDFFIKYTTNKVASSSPVYIYELFSLRVYDNPTFDIVTKPAIHPQGPEEWGTRTSQHQPSPISLRLLKASIRAIKDAWVIRRADSLLSSPSPVSITQSGVESSSRVLRRTMLWKTAC
jgi:hypothetical protein